ncbi:hypothetical protein EJB05_11698, partial [Eragrostis curvula]
MAGGAMVNAVGGKDYPGKLTLFVLFTSFIAATGGLIFGYDIGISGKSFGYLIWRRQVRADTSALSFV